ncbi:MAG: Ig-like domain-containing protein [Bacteroidota bacterium]
MRKLTQLLSILVLSFLAQNLIAQNLTFTIRYNSTDDQYEVYGLPDASNPVYFVGGGSQISVVLPASLPDNPLVINTVNGGLWTDNSQRAAPAADPAHDFHGIASNGSIIMLSAGQEILLYTFKLPVSGCIEGIRLFENSSDPQSSDPGMAGGDFNNFFPDLFTFVDGYNGNYDNMGTNCGEICNNGIDDDMDGLIDCEDPDCEPVQLVAQDTLIGDSYCVAVPYADAPIYTITVDGTTYTPPSPGCDFDQMAGYSTVAFTNNPAPHQVDWLFNGTNYTTTVNTVAELVAWMNSLDEAAMWRDDVAPSAFAYTQRNNPNTYGRILTTHGNSLTSTTNLNAAFVPFGSLITPITLDSHLIIVTNNNTGCSDTTQLIYINEPPEIIYAPDTTFQELDTTIVIDIVTTDDSSSEADSTLTYQLAGIDSALFSIDSITGQIRFINPPDFEMPLDDGMNNIYDITVIVCDDDSPALCDTQAVAITVTDYTNEGTVMTACGEDVNWIIYPGSNGSYQTDIGGTGPTSYGTGWWLGQGAFAFNNTGTGGAVTLTFDNPVTDLQLYIQAQQMADVVTFSVPAMNVVQDQSGNHTTAGTTTLSGDGLTLTSSAPNNGTDWGVDTRVNFGSQAITTITISSSQGYNGTVLRAFNLDGSSAINCPKITPPLAIIDRAVTAENVPTTIDVQVNDLENGGGDLVTTVIGTSTQGVTPLVLDDDSLSYAPQTNFIGLDTITYQVCFVNNPSICDTTIVLVTVSPDSDGDGVSDAVDLDDDNDGLPDLVECPFVEVTFTLNQAISDSNALVYEAMVAGQLETVTITASNNPQSNLNQNNVVEPSGVQLSNSLTQPIAMKDDSLFESAITFTPSIPIQSIRIEGISDFDRQTGDFPTDALGFSQNGFWTIVTGDLASYDPATGQVVTNNPAGDAVSLTATDDSAFELVQKGIRSPILARGTLGETFNGEAIFTAYSPFNEIELVVEDLSLSGLREQIDNTSIVASLKVGVPLCDEDGDGLPDYLDLDSDGDGCSDAKEAGHFLAVQADSTISGPYGENGLADAVETATDSDTLNYTILADTTGTYQFLDSLLRDACNEPPVANDDVVSVNVNTPRKIDVQGNDTDSDNDNLTTAIIGISTQGVTPVVVNGDSIIYTPALDFVGKDTFQYQICDDGLMPLCDTAIVFITVQADRDGDGIPDVTDLDDDNDGILDWDECEAFDVQFDYVNALSSSSQLVFRATINGQVETITLTASTNAQSLLNPSGVVEPNGTTLTPTGPSGEIALRDDATMEAALTFTSTTPISYIKFDDLDDIDRQTGNLPTDALGFNTTGYWDIISGDLAAYEPSNGSLAVNNPNDNAESNLSNTDDSAFEMDAKGNLSGVLVRGNLGETNNGQATFIASAPFTTTDLLTEDLSLSGNREFIQNNFVLSFLIVGVPECDPDMDGIPNYFDLDSDGDGCPDAVEAGHRVTMQVDSTIVGPYGNNGVADTVETDDTNTARANYTLTETNSGVFDFVDNSLKAGCEEICGNGLDDDNDGFTDCEDTDCMPIQLADLDTLTNTTYCLDLPLADADFYTILLDGNTYDPGTLGCDFDQRQGYSTFDFALNPPPHAVTWMFNGAPYTDTVNTVQELVDWMNTIDTDAMWRSDVVPNAIGYTQDNNSDTYGPITVARSGGTAVININAVFIPFGTSIDVVTLDSHQIIITNNNSGCSDTINLIPSNQAPTALNDTVVSPENTITTIRVQVNDSDPDNDTLITSIIGNSTAGANPTVLNGDSLSYTPPVNFAGVDTVTYQICDTGNPALCDTAKVFISVLADSDNDGIVDLIDLDDDNDGILDIVESLGFDPALTNSCAFPKANFSADSVIQVVGTAGPPFVGDAFRFRNVVSIDAIPLDAVITITAADSNITTFTIDNDGTGDPAAWQAEYNVPAGQSATMEYEIVFTVANTNSVVPLDRFGGIFYDIDGANANESITLTNPSLYVVEDSTQLEVITNLAGDVTFQGPLFTYPGIVLNTEIAAYFNYFNLNSFKFSTTANNVTANPNTNFFSLVFDVCSISTFEDLDYVINSGVDSDGDMIGDELDNDSDDDGCFDAVEGGGNFELTTDVNPLTGQLLGGVDTLTGIPLIAGNGQASNTAVVINGPDSDKDGIPDACDAVDNRIDTDGDGIIDLIDVDDDNDGILDVDEGAPTCSNSVTTSINTKMTNGVLDYQLNQNLASQLPLELNNGAYIFDARFVDGPGDTGTPMWQNGVQIRDDQGPTIGDYLYLQPVMVGQVASGDYVEYEFTFPTPLDQFEFQIGGLNNADYSEITAYNGATPIAITQDNFSNFNPSPGNWEVAKNRVIGHNVGGGTDVTTNLVTINIPGPVSKVIIASGRGNNTDGSSTTAIHTVVGCLPSIGQDSDNDSIPDYLDLDADNDGCLDAEEAGHNQPVQADSTIAGPYGNNGLATSVENSDTDTATVNYTFTETNSGTYDFLDSLLQTGCDQITTLMLKVMLQGAMLGTNDGLMRDDLRRLNALPLNQPYVDSLNTHGRFIHTGGGSEVTNLVLLSANANPADAIVDWVFVELRNEADSTLVFQTLSALVQRDGDIVDATTGEPPILMNPPLNFFVSVKHRNHLGAMKKSPVQTVNDTARVDFTTLPLDNFFTHSGYDSLAVTTMSGKRALWAGNANIDVKSKYDGATNDRIIIGNNTLSFRQNVLLNLNFGNAFGYFQGDVDMDGIVKYDGANNDRIRLQNILLNYPLNFRNLRINNFNNMIEQVP